MRKQDPYKFDQLMACGVDAVVLGSSLQLPLLKSKRKIPFVVAGVDEAGRGPFGWPGRGSGRYFARFSAP
jgi:hypothetical protein